MSVNGYIGWSSHCNRIILDSTSITLGEEATTQTELASGRKRSALRGSYCPDKYSVTMEFEWEQTDESGKNELQYFYEWYKYKHKFGTVPFEFPKILYSPNSGIKPYDDHYSYREVEYYKITSAVEGKKSGTKVQVNMTWETVYGGVISINEPNPSVNFIEATSSFLNIYYTSIGDLIPVLRDFTVYIDDTEVQTNGIYFDGINTVRIFYNFTPEFEQGQTERTFRVTFAYRYSTETYSFVINKDDFITTFTESINE